MVTAVYVPTSANANAALSLLHTAIDNQQTTYPEAVHIIAGDLNHFDLRTILPKYHQHIKCATRGENILDKVYSTIKHGFRAEPLPHLGQSDYGSVFVIPPSTHLRMRAPNYKDC